VVLGAVGELFEDMVLLVLMVAPGLQMQSAGRGVERGGVVPGGGGASLVGGVDQGDSRSVVRAAEERERRTASLR
jgi:hypothetical protein